MPSVSPDTLAKLRKLPSETVTVPILGEVLVVGMSGRERDAWEASRMEGRGKKREFNMKNVRATLVAACARDPKDNVLLFPDVEALGDVRADIIDPLYAAAARLSGITKEDEDALGKPLETETPSASSSSASPAS